MQIKSHSEFHKDKSRKDGCYSYCKECRKIKTKLYNYATREIRNKKAREYYHNNKEHCKEIRKRYENSEKFKITRLNSFRRQKAKNPQKYRARDNLRMMVFLGKIEKPDSCESCGKTDCRICGHHYKGYDDKHSLDVQWLCDECHYKVHNEST